MVTWDVSESKFEEDMDVGNMCFMAIDDNLTKVNPKPHLDDDKLTMDELANFFEELQETYELSKVQNKKLRKENEFLQNKLDIILKKYGLLVLKK